MSSSSRSTIDAFLMLTASTAAMAVVGLGLLQTDVCSRKILSKERLQEKRKREYQYRWEKCLEANRLRCYYKIAGGIGQGVGDQFSTTIKSEPDLQELVDQFTTSSDNDKQTCWRVMAIHRADLAAGRREVWLEFENRVKVPLVKFGLLLSQAFEKKTITTALCFVADASSGLGTELVAGIIRASKAGVAILEEPLWMACFASLVQDKIISSKSQLDKILFALCRLEAWRVRDEYTGSTDAKTVMFTLPGQSTTSTLLPMLQSIFPEDRHVFVYDGCVNSIQRGIYHRNTYSGRGKIPDTLEQCFTIQDDPTIYTAPLQHSFVKSCHGLVQSLQELPLNYADTIECWMSSVNSFVILKEDEEENGYSPYVLRCDYLVNKKDDVILEGSDKYYTLSSLIQFITDCATIPTEVLDAAKEWLLDYTVKTIIKETSSRYPNIPVQNKAGKKKVEDAVFNHKQILIEDKTLVDTVQPRQHWTLKQTVRSGCLCCEPDDIQIFPSKTKPVLRQLKMQCTIIDKY